MTNSNAIAMIEAVERYTQSHAFPEIDRVEMFFSSSSPDDRLIGGQIVDVVDRSGAKHEVPFAPMFQRLVQYKVTAEKRGNGWNITCAPGVMNARFSGGVDS